MERMAIDRGVDGDGGNAHLLASSEDTEGDFTSVGNENFRKLHL